MNTALKRAIYANSGSFRRRAKVSMSPHDMWVLQSKQFMIKLVFLLLTYLYTEDDGEVSFFENRSIKRLLRKNGSFLDKEDYDEILQFTSILPDYPFVMNYISKNNVNNKLVMESIQSVRKIIKRKKVYLEILSDLEKTIQLYNS